MKKIRIHGRGGQGNVTAAELLAVAAFEDGKFSQAFPAFGSERMGAPVLAFVKINEKRIRAKGQIQYPDYVIVQDPTLIGTIDVFSGLSQEGLAILNTERSLDELGLETDRKVITIPATKIAVEETGRPVPNTTLLGAFAAVTGEVSLSAIKKSIAARFPKEVAKRNIDAVDRAFKYVKEHYG